MSDAASHVPDRTLELGARAQRTRALLVHTARGIFLEKGYGGTRVDDIAEAAGTSRASFYTYFVSKRDILEAAGVESKHAAAKTLALLRDIPTEWTIEDLSQWIQAWLAFLDVHGSFLLVWGQAATEDENIRQLGVRTEMRHAKTLAETLIRLGHESPVHASADALALLGMTERLWYYHYVAGGRLDPDDMLESILRILMGLLRGRPDKARPAKGRAKVG